MLSFDTVSLYTSIPHDLAVSSVFYACTDSNVNLPLCITVIQEHVSFCLINNCFTFNYVYYSKTRGTTIGPTLSVRTAEIVMQ